MEVLGERLDSTVATDSHIGTTLKVVDKCEENVERLATLGKDAPSPFFDQRHLSLLKKLHELDIGKEGKAVAKPSSVGAYMGEEILKRSSVGEVATPLASDAEFASRLIHLFEQNHLRSLAGGSDGSHHTSCTCPYNDDIAHQVLER